MGFFQTRVSRSSSLTPGLTEQSEGLGDGEGIGDAPVAGAVDDHALDAILLDDRHHAGRAHLRVGIDRESLPSAGVAGDLDRLFVAMVEEDAVHGDARGLNDLDAADEALALVAVGRMHQDRQIVLNGQLDLSLEEALFLGRHVIEADLADADNRVLFKEAGQNLHHRLIHAVVVGLAGIESHRAEMVDAELLGTVLLPSENRVEVVDESRDVGARLPQPKGRFEDDADAGSGHPLVVVGDPRVHVTVRLKNAGLSHELSRGGSA